LPFGQKGGGLKLGELDHQPPPVLKIVLDPESGENPVRPREHPSSDPITNERKSIPEEF
jgi:hypothetical protein